MLWGGRARARRIMLRHHRLEVLQKPPSSESVEQSLSSLSLSKWSLRIARRRLRRAELVGHARAGSRGGVRSPRGALASAGKLAACPEAAA